MIHEQGELFETVKCAQCGETIPRHDAFFVEKHTDGEDIKVPFCGEGEASEYYLERLRESGMC